MSLFEDFTTIFGFQLGYNAGEEAMNIVSNTYRAKDFDPVVRKDLLDIMSKGKMENIPYPFPTRTKAPRKPIFLVRHKPFGISVLLWIVISILMMMNAMKTENYEMLNAIANITILFMVFWFFYIMVLLIKKILRIGKKTSDVIFQSEFINQGMRYWNVREYVRQALEMGELDVQGAYIRIRNTELGRQLPETDTELEAKVFNSRNNKG